MNLLALADSFLRVCLLAQEREKPEQQIHPHHRIVRICTAPHNEEHHRPNPVPAIGPKSKATTNEGSQRRRVNTCEKRDEIERTARVQMIAFVFLLSLHDLSLSLAEFHEDGVAAAGERFA